MHLRRNAEKSKRNQAVDTVERGGRPCTRTMKKLLLRSVIVLIALAATFALLFGLPLVFSALSDKYGYDNVVTAGISAGMSIFLVTVGACFAWGRDK